jgi:hypothetical protein
MKKIFSTLFINIGLIYGATAQSGFTLKNIDLEVKGMSTTFNTKVEDLQELKEICTFLKQDLTAILSKNKMNLKTFKPSNMEFNLNTANLHKDNSNPKGAISVFYKIKKGDNLFKVAKVINKEEVAAFKSRNKLKSDDLKLGSKVLLGWLSGPKLQTPKIEIVKSKPDVKSTLVSSSSKEVLKVSSKLNPLKKDTLIKSNISETELRNKNYNSGRGVAYWQHGHKSSRSKYALHNSAPINSSILLYNPMIKKSIVAKVVGRIPSDNYNEDIDIVLSEGAAVALGAKDSRFSVEIKYESK